MPILQWHDSVYAIGVEEIDRQHRQLVRLINQAQDCASSGGDPERVLSLMQGMAGYATGHFAAEETLMAEAGYDRLEVHLGEHEVFEAQTRRYGEALRRGEVPDPDEIFRFLAHWLSAHILEVDAAFGRFLKASGG